MSDKQEPNTTNNNAAMMIAACASGNLSEVLSLLGKSSNPQLTAALQDESTGRSPLMAAAEKGHLDICNLLLEHGAPWNAVDRRGRCAGNYATDAEHWDIVNLLVEHATKAELILGASMRSMKGATNNMPPPPIPTKNDKEDAKDEQNNNESDEGTHRMGVIHKTRLPREKCPLQCRWDATIGRRRRRRHDGMGTAAHGCPCLHNNV